MTRRWAAASALLLASCSGGSDTASTDSAPRSRPEFATSGGCNAATFWALSADGSVSLRVSVQQAERSADEPTVISVDVPDPSVYFVLQQGVDLGQALCADVVTDPYRLDSTVEPGSGRLTIELGPRSTCAEPAHGTLVLQGVVMADGTRLPDLVVKTDAIDCFAG